MNNTALAVRTDDKQLDALRRIVEQETPKNEIRVRAGRGGMQLKYTDGAYVIRTLNAAFGWDWDFVADSEELLLNNGQPFEVKVRGTLTVRLNGQAVTKTQFGCQPIEMLKNGNAPVSIGDCYKGAATDALKKCASMLGIALDLYDSDYKAEKYAEPTPEPDALNWPEPKRREQPVRNVELDAADVENAPEPQPPKRDGKQQSSNGTVRAIMSLAGFLGWDGKTLANEVYTHPQLRVSISEEDPARSLEAMDKLQLKTLLQVLQSEKNKMQEAKND